MRIPIITKLAMASVFFATTSAAQTSEPIKLEEEIQRIGAIQDDKTRLNEFDTLVVNTSIQSESSVASGGNGKWIVTKDKSKMDDSLTVAVFLPAEEDANASLRKGDLPAMVIRYFEGKIEAYLSLGAAPSSDVITIRFDSEDAFNISSAGSSNREALFLSNAKAFIRQIAESEQMLVRFTPFNSGHVVVEFDTHGLLTAIRDIEKASGWDINNPRTFLEERLEQAWDDMFLYEGGHGGALLDGLVSYEEMRGNRWKSYSRDGSTLSRIERHLKLVEQASEPWPAAKYRITVTGTTSRKKSSDDGGAPFTSSELGALTRKAIEKIGWDAGKYELVVAEDKEPVLYTKEDGYENIIGLVKSTGERFEIEVLGIGE